MLSPLPRRSDSDHSCSITQPYQPSPKWRSGRPAQRPFRGLLSVHSRYGLHTRAATIFAARFTGGFNRFVTSTVAPVASGWSRLPGGTLTHWESAALTRRTPEADVRISLNLAPYVCLRPRPYESAKRQEPVVNCTGSRDFPTPTWEIRISSETPLPSPPGASRLGRDAIPMSD